MAVAKILVSAEELIDLPHYSRQVGHAFVDHSEAYQHFVSEGQRSRLEPSPFLYTDWYGWQNPDAAKCKSVLDHFASRALVAPIDPAPFIDSVGFLAAHPHYRSMVEVMSALLTHRETGVSPRLDVHLAKLLSAQQRVHAAIKSKFIRRHPTRRRRLVMIQAGPNFSFSQWYDDSLSRSWDLMCNWYSLGGMDLRFGEIHLRQQGTKVTAMNHILRTYPDLFLPFDQVLFLDDDLTIKHADIDRLFDVAERHSLDLFQAALTRGSFCVWPDLFQKGGKTVRMTTAVEIMMPGFSRRALQHCAPLFGTSVSGFGLDFAISERIRGVGWKCGVVDSVGVGHHAKIDEGAGAFYNLMRALGINQKLELYAVIRELGKRPEFKEL
jgi:hypothetical protein